MDLAFGESAFRGIKDGFPDAIIARPKGIYQESQPPMPNPRICLIAMRHAIIQNGRVSFVTRLGEYVDLKLNCRENLDLSPSPVRLQMRLLEDDDDVGDVAVVKLEAPDLSLRNPTYQAVCEGLILSTFITYLQMFYFIFYLLDFSLEDIFKCVTIFLDVTGFKHTPYTVSTFLLLLFPDSDFKIQVQCI